MAEATYYVALPFAATDDGIAAGEPTECFNIGAVAISRTGDPATGDFIDAKVIRTFGDVPDDLSTL